MIVVEVVYATPERQVLLSIKVTPSETVENAIRQSGILAQFPEIDLSTNPVGIFGKVCPLKQALRNGDRIEIYRSLLNDPKTARRQRAEKARTKK